MPKYNEIKSFFVRAMVVSLSVVFIAGIVPTTKAFAEPGSVFLWGGYDDDGLFDFYNCHGRVHELVQCACQTSRTLGLWME